MPPDAKTPPHEFPTTWWTLIEQALADGTTVRNTALEQIVLRYVPPLRAHLVLRKRLGEELADELLQAFVTEKFVAQYLLRHADRTQGKFRSLLVRSLENYHTDWLRARAHQPATGTPFVDELAHAGPDVFDVAWARQVLEEVLTMMRADCHATAQAEIWGVFECRLLNPTREGVEPLAYDAVCERFGFASPEQASNALVTAKRKFQRAFERVALHYCHDGEQADELLGELSAVLARSGPLEWRRAPEASSSTGSATRSSELDDSQAAQILRLLEAGSDPDDLWGPEDLRRLMRHQLAQPLVSLERIRGFQSILDTFSLTGCVPLASLERIRGFQAPAGKPAADSAPLNTLDDLFRHPAPPLEMLEVVKRYGRQHARQNEASLPVEVASALYFAAIAAALVRYDQRITKSDDELLRFGFHGMLERPWIESPLRELFTEGLAKLAFEQP